jgi:hypothetical protein
VKTLQCEHRWKDITNNVRQEIHARITLLSAIIKEQVQMEERIKDSFKIVQGAYKECKKKVEEMKAARGKPETSIVADLELTLAKYHVSHAAYHGGVFNGVCCRRIVGSAKPICDEIRAILGSKRDRSCEKIIVYNKMDNFENTLGLLDASFAYLNI